MPARVLRFGRLQPNERVLLELPLGRSPPVQGSLLDVLGVLVAPRGPQNGFDERTWLRRHGVHVVLRGDRWRLVGHRQGLAAVPDRLHAWIARSVAPRLHGERRALLVGVVLGDDQGLDDTLRQRFRAAGLYHLLAVSGQNVALIATAIVLAAWLLGIPRVLGELGALVAMTGYVLAVGPQPSVIRAGVAGGLASARVADGSRAGPLVHAPARRARPPGLESVRRPRCRLPALVRRRGRDLRPRSEAAPPARGLPGAAAARRRSSPSRLRAASRRRRSRGCSSTPSRC